MVLGGAAGRLMMGCEPPGAWGVCVVVVAFSRCFCDEGFGRLYFRPSGGDGGGLGGVIACRVVGG